MSTRFEPIIRRIWVHNFLRRSLLSLTGEKRMSVSQPQVRVLSNLSNRWYGTLGNKWRHSPEASHQQYMPEIAAGQLQPCEAMLLRLDRLIEVSFLESPCLFVWDDRKSYADCLRSRFLWEISSNVELNIFESSRPIEEVGCGLCQHPVYPGDYLLTGFVLA